MNEFYDNNKDFKDYVDRYCKSNKCTKEESFEHQMVINAYEFIKEKTNEV